MVVIKLFEMMFVMIVVFGELLMEVGCLVGVVNIVFGYGDLVGMVMIIDKCVDMVIFIGLIVVGKVIVKVVFGILKKVFFEFGGKNL